jgi:hypothetical protein
MEMEGPGRVELPTNRFRNHNPAVSVIEAPERLTFTVGIPPMALP